MPYFLRKISIEQFPHKEVNHPLESFNQKWNFALTDVAQLFGHHYKIISYKIIRATKFLSDKTQKNSVKEQ